MNTLMRLTRWTGVALAGSLVVACGGEPSFGDNPDFSTGGVQVPGSAYVAGSQERVAFELLNAERVHCGFGALQQSAPLDKASAAHALWQVSAQQLSHQEWGVSPQDNLYTGAWAIDRAFNQGYGKSTSGVDASRNDIVVDEVYTAFFGANPSWLGGSAVRLLLNAPYHLARLTGPYREVGVSSRLPAEGSSGFSTVVMELGRITRDGPQPLSADGGVATYPCEGSDEVMYSLSHEDPNPISGRNLAEKPLGTTIIVRVDPGQTLAIDSVSLKEVQTGQSVKVLAHVGGTNGQWDAHGTFDESVAYVAADAPMKPLTSYTANIKGRKSGQAFEKNFTFKTGSLSYGAH